MLRVLGIYNFGEPHDCGYLSENVVDEQSQRNATLLPHFSLGKRKERGKKLSFLHDKLTQKKRSRLGEKGCLSAFLSILPSEHS